MKKVLRLNFFLLLNFLYVDIWVLMAKVRSSADVLVDFQSNWSYHCHNNFVKVLLYISQELLCSRN